MMFIDGLGALATSITCWYDRVRMTLPCLPHMSNNSTVYHGYNRNGPTHGEVKWFLEEPVLVEVGARCHGGDGLWLALGDECFGCNQAKCAIDSYIFRDVYAMMPDAVSVFQIVFICIN